MFVVGLDGRHVCLHGILLQQDLRVPGVSGPLQHAARVPLQSGGLHDSRTHRHGPIVSHTACHTLNHL